MADQTAERGEPAFTLHECPGYPGEHIAGSPVCVPPAPNFNDPRAVYDGVTPRPAYRRGYPETWWKVEGWDEYADGKGGSCSYGGSASFAEATAEAQQMREHGDDQGRRYQHYDVLEMVFEVMVVVTVHDVPEPRLAPAEATGEADV